MKMNCAKEARELFVQSLSAGSRFNVVSFSSWYSSLFGTSEQDMEEIAKFDSKMGGTEILSLSL
jgi:hypothetical protein